MSQLVQEGLRARRFRMGRTIMALMLREMSTTYGRSPGGYLWAILEPLGAIAVLTLIISVGLKVRVPALGTNFMFFYATGMLPFILFQRTSVKVTMSLSFSRALLFYPGVTFVDAILARFLLGLVTQLLVSYIVLSGLMVFSETRAMLDLPSVVISLMMAALLALGVGCVNCVLFAFFPLWSSFWGILTSPLFFMSGILYTYEDLPEFARNIIWYNPLVHVTGMMRQGFYPTYTATYVSYPYVFGIGALCLGFGVMLLSRHYRAIINL